MSQQKGETFPDSNESDEFARNLGTYERFRADLHDLGFHYNVSLTGVFSVPDLMASDSVAYKSHVLRAVATVVRQHPNLSLQIRRSSLDCFVRLSAVDVGKVVEWKTQPADSDSGRNLEGFLSEQSSLPFTDPRSPLWRIICLDLGNNGSGNSGGSHQCAICFVYHHAIADGKSGSAVMVSLQEALCRDATVSDEDGETEDDFRVQTSSAKISASMDELVPYHTTWGFQLRAILRRSWQYLGSLRDPSPFVWTGGIFQFDENGRRARTLIRVIHLDAALAKRLRDNCRAHGTSVTAILQVLVGCVLLGQYPKAEALRCATALSLRRFFNPSAGIDERKVGVWIDAFSCVYKRGDLPDITQASEDAVWKAAVKSKQAIEREVRKGLDNLSFASLQGAVDFKPQLRGLLGKTRQNSYSITNLGLLPETPQHGTSKPNAWRLENVIFSQSAHVNGSAVQFCFISCEAGGMSISMNWQEGVVLESDMDAVKTSLESELRRWSI